MELPSAKDLKRLAAACRKAGITSFEGNGIKLTFSDAVPYQAPARNQKADKAPANDFGDAAFESDSLTPDQLLYWSTGIEIDAVSPESEEQ